MTSIGLPLQLAGLVIVAAALTLAPPRSGAMLLVPIGPQPLGRTLNLALAEGALPIAAGPFAGSLVVRGERRRLLPLLARGIVPFSAPRAWCSA